MSDVNNIYEILQNITITLNNTHMMIISLWLVVFVNIFLYLWKEDIKETLHNKNESKLSKTLCIVLIIVMTGCFIFATYQYQSANTEFLKMMEIVKEQVGVTIGTGRYG